MTVIVRGHPGQILNSYVARDGSLMVEIGCWGEIHPLYNRPISYFGWVDIRATSPL